MFLQWRKMQCLLRTLTGSTVLLFCVGCATTQPVAVEDNLQPWLDEIKFAPAPDLSQLVSIDEPMSKAVAELFENNPRSTMQGRAAKLANWMIDPDGLGMRYNLDANYFPQDAFGSRTANCLSFTILLSVLAAEVGLEIEMNEVDIPTSWGYVNEERMVFYRHVNAVHSVGNKRVVFDLAMQSYRFDYPQRTITHEHAFAQLLSNQAVAEIHSGNYQQAEKLIRAALATYADDPDLWVNLGVIMERLAQPGKAEAVYLHAYNMSAQTVTAVTNLARIYAQQGKVRESQRFEKRAKQIRNRNPYHHFMLAQEQFDAKNYRGAKASVNRAIKLHNEDGRFFELRSRIAQVNSSYTRAFRDMKKAYELSMQDSERFSYRSKAAWLAVKSAEQKRERDEWKKRYQQPYNVTIDSGALF